MVFGDNGPAILLGPVLDLLAPGVDHRLDGEGHAHLELVQRAGLAVVQHLRLFMEHAANAVAAKLAHHAEALAFGKFLDCPAHVAQPRAGLDHLDAVPHGVIGDAAQAPGGNRGVAHDEHAAGVAVPAVLDHRHVDVDDVAFFELLVVGDAMAHLVVDRRADRLGVRHIAAAPVVQRRGNATLHFSDVVKRQLVQRVGRDAGLHMCRQKIQHFRGQPARNAHAAHALGVFVGNRHAGNYPRGQGKPKKMGIWSKHIPNDFESWSAPEIRFGPSDLNLYSKLMMTEEAKSWIICFVGTVEICGLLH